MRLSVIIVTRNRRETLQRTIEMVNRYAGMHTSAYEIIVVDNASGDGTPQMLREFDDVSVQCIRRRSNEGATARNYGLSVATGQYVLFIDDDSYPVGETVPRALAYLDAHQNVAAVVGRVELADGSAEASALPGVVICCGFFVRRDVLDEVGAFPIEFNRQAEEYDLSFRIWNAGYVIDRFEDLVFIHEKVPANRVAADILRFDARNNLALVDRYLPAEFRSAYRSDWLQRYLALARHAGCPVAARRGRLEAEVWRFRYRSAKRRPLSSAAFEQLFQLREQTRLVGEWSRREGIRRILIADFSKNVYATWHACMENSIEVLSLFDPHPAYVGMKYRGLTIIDRILQDADGIVVSNVNPAQVDAVIERIRRQFDGPVLGFWEPRTCPTASDARLIARVGIEAEQRQRVAG